MDGLSRFVLAALGGALVAYGFIRRGATKRKYPFSTNPIESQMLEPDEGARTDGALALVMGAAFLLGALFG